MSIEDLLSPSISDNQSNLKKQYNANLDIEERRDLQNREYTPYNPTSKLGDAAYTVVGSIGQGGNDLIQTANAIAGAGLGAIGATDLKEITRQNEINAIRRNAEIEEGMPKSGFVGGLVRGGLRMVPELAVIGATGGMVGGAIKAAGMGARATSIAETAKNISEGLYWGTAMAQRSARELQENARQSTFEQVYEANPQAAKDALIQAGGDKQKAVNIISDHVYNESFVGQAAVGLLMLPLFGGANFVKGVEGLVGKGTLAAEKAAKDKIYSSVMEALPKLENATKPEAEAILVKIKEATADISTKMQEAAKNGGVAKNVVAGTAKGAGLGAAMGAGNTAIANYEIQKYLDPEQNIEEGLVDSAISGAAMMGGLGGVGGLRAGLESSSRQRSLRNMKSAMEQGKAEAEYRINPIEEIIEPKVNEAILQNEGNLPLETSAQKLNDNSNITIEEKYSNKQPQDKLIEQQAPIIENAPIADATKYSLIRENQKEYKGLTTDFLEKNKDLHEAIKSEGGDIIIAKNAEDPILPSNIQAALKRGRPANYEQYDAVSAQVGNKTILFSDNLKDNNEGRAKIYHEVFHDKWSKLASDEQGVHVDKALKQSALLASKEFRQAVSERTPSISSKMSYDEVQQAFKSMDGLTKWKTIEESLSQLREKQMAPGLMNKVKRFFQSVFEVFKLRPSTKELHNIINDVVSKKYEPRVEKLDPARDLIEADHLKLRTALRDAAVLQKSGNIQGAAEKYREGAILMRKSKTFDMFIPEVEAKAAELSSPNLSLKQKEIIASGIDKTIPQKKQLENIQQDRASYSYRKKEFASLLNKKEQEELGERSKPKRGIWRTIKPYVQGASDTLKHFSDDVRQKAFESVSDKLAFLKIDKDKAEPLFTALNKLKSDRAWNEIGMYLYNGEKQKAENFLVANGNSRLAARKMIAEMSDVFADIERRAFEAGIDMGHVKDYFARTLKDRSGLLHEVGLMDIEKENAIRQKAGQRLLSEEEKIDIIRRREEPILEALEKAKSKKGGIDLTPIEEAEIINTLLKNPNNAKGMSNVKSRAIENIPPRLMKFYSTPQDSFLRYIEGMESLIAEKKMYGSLDPAGIGKDIERIKSLRRQYAAATDPGKKIALQQEIDALAPKLQDDNSIARIAINLTKSGVLKAEDLPNFKDALSTFHAKAASGKEVTLKNAIYILTMGQVKSAIRQLPDLMLSVVENGPVATGKAFAIEMRRFRNKELQRKYPVDLKDLGLDSSPSFEMMGEGHLKEAVRQVFKWTGVTLTDKIGKEVMVTAAFERAIKDLEALKRGEVGAMARFNNNIRKVFGEGIAGDMFKKELESGKFGPKARQYALFKLHQYFPTTSATGAPAMVKGAALTKLAYQFKSYPLKFLNMYVEQTKGLWEDGDRLTMKADRMLATGNPKLKAEAESLLAQGHELRKRSVINAGVIPLVTLTGNMLATLLINQTHGRAGANTETETLLSEFLNLTGISRFTWSQIISGDTSSALGSFMSPGVSLMDGITKDLKTFIKLSREGKDPWSYDKYRAIAWMPLVGAPLYWHSGKGAEQVKKARREINK